MTKEELLAKYGGIRRVLDHGHVRLIDVMGDDASVVRAARVSYGQGTKTVNQDRGLIRYLIRNWHTSPVEMCECVFHLKMPIFVARQLVRHRTCSMNEVSARYSEMPDEYYVPEVARMQKQSKTNKQGSGDAFDEGEARTIQGSLNNGMSASMKAYKQALKVDLAREVARVSMPVSAYTEMYWKMDLRNLLHFLRLRLDSHAQLEIRVFAKLLLTW